MILFVVLILLGIFCFIGVFISIYEESTILFLIVLLVGIASWTGAAHISGQEEDMIREYDVSSVEVYESCENSGHKIYKFLISQENNTYVQILLTDEKVELYYRDNKFYISNKELKKMV